MFVHTYHPSLVPPPEVTSESDVERYFDSTLLTVMITLFILIQVVMMISTCIKIF